ILASIRRIIADDDINVSARRERQERHKIGEDHAEPRMAPEPVAPPPRIADATEAPAADAHVEPTPINSHYEAPQDLDEEERLGLDDDDASEQEAEAAYHEAYVAHEQPEHEFGDEGQNHLSPAGQPSPLVSPDAAAAIAAQFQTLAASMVINDSGLLHDYAREMLRPMLKAWLDDNLPVLVERLVRVEIERVARGGRR
ncbi:MAG: DUF2497 domain-containing protein, partial [Methylocystis sp.]